MSFRQARIQTRVVLLGGAPTCDDRTGRLVLRSNLQFLLLASLLWLIVILAVLYPSLDRSWPVLVAAVVSVWLIDWCMRALLRLRVRTLQLASPEDDHLPVETGAASADRDGTPDPALDAVDTLVRKRNRHYFILVLLWGAAYLASGWTVVLLVPPFLIAFSYRRFVPGFGGQVLLTIPPLMDLAFIATKQREYDDLVRTLVEAVVTVPFGFEGYSLLPGETFLGLPGPVLGLILCVAFPLRWLVQAVLLLLIFALLIRVMRFSPPQTVLVLFLTWATVLAIDLEGRWDGGGGRLAVLLVVYSAILLGFRSRLRPLRILYLRGFRNPPRSDSFIRHLTSYWQFCGPVELIVGPDAVESLQGPEDILNVIFGRMRSVVIRTKAQMLRHLSKEVHGIDGTWRARSYLCSDGAWRTMVELLARRASVIILDCEGLDQSQGGLDYEIDMLRRLGRRDRVLVISTVPDSPPDLEGLSAFAPVALSKKPGPADILRALETVSLARARPLAGAG